MIRALLACLYGLVGSMPKRNNDFSLPTKQAPVVGFKRDGTRTENTLTMRSNFAALMDESQRRVDEAYRVRDIIEPLREFYSRRPRPWLSPNARTRRIKTLQAERSESRRKLLADYERIGHADGSFMHAMRFDERGKRHA